MICFKNNLETVSNSWAISLSFQVFLECWVFSPSFFLSKCQIRCTDSTLRRHIGNGEWCDKTAVLKYHYVSSPRVHSAWMLNNVMNVCLQVVLLTYKISSFLKILQEKTSPHIISFHFMIIPCKPQDCIELWHRYPKPKGRMRKWWKGKL